MCISKIERLTYGFESYGYFVDAQPLPGMEEIFANELANGLAKIENVFQINAKRYGFRGKSKRALNALHGDLPEPIWGVGLR